MHSYLCGNGENNPGLNTRMSYGLFLVKVLGSAQWYVASAIIIQQRF